jgi:AAA15 family ATPase/GTPase
MLHCELDGLPRAIPLLYMGGGFARLTTVLISIATAANGVVLVDEIENGLYYRHMPGVWRAVADAARSSNTQVIATTHSRECVQAAHEVFALEPEYDFALHRMELTNGSPSVVTYGREELGAAISLDLELR